MGKLLILSVFFVLIFVSAAFAEEIKIGLGVSDIYPVSGDMELGYLKREEYIICDEISDYERIEFKPAEGSFYKSSERYDSFSQAKEIAADFKDVYPVLCDKNEWYLYKKSRSDGFNTGIMLGTNGIFAQADNDIAFIVDLPSSLQIAKPSIKTIEYENKTYRGRIELLIKNSQFNIINNVDIEEYLCGVVPAEMPASWNIEALRAQAVAARTYAKYSVKVHLADGYNLCSSTHCQVYGGISSEVDSSNRAVKDTEGVCIYSEGQLIDAVFTPSSGGYSSDAKDVWGKDTSYLKGVKDVFDTTNHIWERAFSLSDLTEAAKDIGTVKSVTLKRGAKSGRVKELILNGSSGEKRLVKEDIRNFFKLLGGALKSSRFTLHSEGVAMPANTPYNSEDLSLSVLSKDGNVIDKNVNDISVTDADGNISKLPDYITDASLVAEKINKETENFPENEANFIISETSEGEEILDETSISDPVIFKGAGYGHGVGMSQYGAQKMADMGYDYIQILKHYYRDVAVK